MARPRGKAFLDALAGHGTVALLGGLRLIDRRRIAPGTAWLLRHAGPLLKEQKIARAQLVAAFPEKSPDEIERIIAGMWDNLGRVAAEFAHMDRFRVADPDRPGPVDITYSPETLERFHRLRTDGKPALIFTAHLANWELPAVVAAAHGLDAISVYRRPNIGAAADAVLAIRSGAMGELMATSMDAPLKLADALAQGRHVGMLVDQYAVRGVPVTFFGRPTRANALLARLARHVDCPIHGVRMIRQPDGRTFRAELTEAVTPARDADGLLDVQGIMQAVTSVIEDWVREYPEQWLWAHRRWRPEDERRS
ncbi:MAG: lipid A biosynthesis lauroyl acyltransferase [Pseudolabrys sp.]|nr:lipid A biosynthesis lauroyl acyltransferase [Pseudolabrys sp.]